MSRDFSPKRATILLASAGPMFFTMPEARYFFDSLDSRGLQRAGRVRRGTGGRTWGDPSRRPRTGRARPRVWKRDNPPRPRAENPRCPAGRARRCSRCPSARKRIRSTAPVSSVASSGKRPAWGGGVPLLGRCVLGFRVMNRSWSQPGGRGDVSPGAHGRGRARVRLALAPPGFFRFTPKRFQFFERHVLGRESPGAQRLFHVMKTRGETADAGAGRPPRRSPRSFGKGSRRRRENHPSPPPAPRGLRYASPL